MRVPFFSTFNLSSNVRVFADRALTKLQISTRDMRKYDGERRRAPLRRAQTFLAFIHYNERTPKRVYSSSRADPYARLFIIN
jgi:hypothetical protein